jgi:hypothetical protein
VGEPRVAQRGGDGRCVRGSRFLGFDALEGASRCGDVRGCVEGAARCCRYRALALARAGRLGNAVDRVDASAAAVDAPLVCLTLSDPDLETLSLRRTGALHRVGQRARRLDCRPRRAARVVRRTDRRAPRAAAASQSGWVDSRLQPCDGTCGSSLPPLSACHASTSRSGRRCGANPLERPRNGSAV